MIANIIYYGFIHVICPALISISLLLVAGIIHYFYPPKDYNKEHIWRSIKLSFYGMWLMAFLESFIFFRIFDPFKTYHNINDYSIAWFIGSNIIFVLVTDFLYYFVHILLHMGFLFTYVHEVHHILIPTAFDYAAVHPIEMITNFLIIHGVSYFIPIYYGSIVVLGSLLSAIALLEHGYGFLAMANIPIVNKIYDYNFHNTHHITYKYNYGIGLFSSMWDKIFNTYYS